METKPHERLWEMAQAHAVATTGAFIDEEGESCEEMPPCPSNPEVVMTAVANYFEDCL